MKKLICAAVAGAFALTGAAYASDIIHFEDDFEAYTDVTELDLLGPWNPAAGTWAISDDQNVTPGGEQSLLEAAGDSTTQVTGNFGPVDNDDLSLDAPLVASYYTYTTAEEADFAGGSIWYRSGLTIAGYEDGGWGAGELEELLAFGWYHSTSRENFSARSAFGGGNWQETDAPLVAQEWVKLEITIDGTEVHFEANDSGDVLTDSYAVPETGGWNGIRLGSYLGFGSANEIDIYYDDVVVRQVVDDTDVQDWHLY